MDDDGLLDLELKGPIGGRDARGNGIFAVAVEAALARHRSATHIEIWINSEGGSLREALRIYRLLRARVEQNTIVTTIANEICASAATLVLMSGDFRQASVGTQLLFHQPDVHPPKGGRWTASMHMERAAELDRWTRNLVQIYSDRCGHGEFFAREIQSEKLLPLDRAKKNNVIHCLYGAERWLGGKPYWYDD